MGPAHRHRRGRRQPPRRASGDADAPRDGDTLWLALPANADQGRIRDAAQAWLQQRAGAWFGARLAHFLQISGLKIRRWRLSSAATRWGSCTSDGNIMLNWRLIHFAPAIIDYVIAHELAHLREMNHSQDFWREVGQILPDFEDAKNILRRHDPASLPHPEAPWRHDDVAADSRPGDHRRTGEGCAAQDYAPWDNDFRELYRQRLRRRAARAPARGPTNMSRWPCPAAVTSLSRPRSARWCRHADACWCRPPAPMPAACSGSPPRPAAWPCRCTGVRDRIDPQAVAQALEQDPTISHVALVCSETSSGICHDAPAIARVAQALGRRVIIDAVSAFGALPLDLSDLPAVDAVALTANKCLEGLPGAAFVVARRDSLDAAQGRAGSWSLDPADIYQQSLQPNAGPRFTPPAPTLAASPSRWRAIMRKAARRAWRATRPICARCTKASARSA